MDPQNIFSHNFVIYIRESEWIVQIYFYLEVED